MHVYRILVFCLFIGLVSRSGAQEQFNPATVILGNFVFSRPDDWVWIKTEPSRKDVQAEVIFGIRQGGYSAAAKTFFNQYEKNAPAGARGAAVDRWKGWFKQKTKSPRASDPILIGTNKVFYSQFSGTYNGPGHELNPIENCTLFGAIIEDKGGNILIRMVGPTDVVRKAIPQLKQMIESALKRE